MPNKKRIVMLPNELFVFISEGGYAQGFQGDNGECLIIGCRCFFSAVALGIKAGISPLTFKMKLWHSSFLKDEEFMQQFDGVAYVFIGDDVQLIIEQCLKGNMHIQCPMNN